MAPSCAGRRATSTSLPSPQPHAPGLQPHAPRLQSRAPRLPPCCVQAAARDVGLSALHTRALAFADVRLQQPEQCEGNRYRRGEQTGKGSDCRGDPRGCPGGRGGGGGGQGGGADRPSTRHQGAPPRRPRRSAFARTLQPHPSARLHLVRVLPSPQARELYTAGLAGDEVLLLAPTVSIAFCPRPHNLALARALPSLAP